MTSSPSLESFKPPIAVYCASNIGKSTAFAYAAISVGRALAAAGRPLVYGGANLGLMGTVSKAVLDAGGRTIGVIPRAMITKGGEGENIALAMPVADNTETKIVNSMHERKVEMAQRVQGFIGLPGGFGTFEEVMEVTTWTQLGIHDKPVVVLNVLSFWEPLRTLIKASIEAGFIRPCGERLVIFVDGPTDPGQHETFDWGKAALEAIDSWEAGKNNPLYNWSMESDSTRRMSSYGRS